MTDDNYERVVRGNNGLYVIENEAHCILYMDYKMAHKQLRIKSTPGARIKWWLRKTQATITTHLSLSGHALP